MKLNRIGTIANLRQNIEIAIAEGQTREQAVDMIYFARADGYGRGRGWRDVILDDVLGTPMSNPELLAMWDRFISKRRAGFSDFAPGYCGPGRRNFSK